MNNMVGSNNTAVVLLNHNRIYGIGGGGGGGYFSSNDTFTVNKWHRNRKHWPLNINDIK